MDICSYLVHLTPGADPATVANTLNALPGCEATAAEDNANLLILVTETNGKAGEKVLRNQIQGVPNIDCLALVFGANEPQPTAAAS